MSETITIFYNNDGKILGSDATAEEITGGVYAQIVTIPDNKVVDYVDTTVIPHKLITKDAPKSETELTLAQVKAIVPTLIVMDGKHTKLIGDNKNNISGALERIAQLELTVSNLINGGN